MPVLLTNDFSLSHPRVNETLVRRLAEYLLVLTGLQDAELSILLTDDGRISELNRTWRHQDGPTNVLAFSLTEGDDSVMARNLLGDIIISVETAAREAEQEGISLHHRLQVLLVHGLLHQLGYDDQSDAQAQKMHAEEDRLLQELGFGKVFSPDQ